jgi:hypothetical protein
MVDESISGRADELIHKSSATWRSRGNFWEVTFAPTAPDFIDWPLESEKSLLNDTGKTRVLITAKPGTRAINLRDRTFRECDVNHFNLADASFTKCVFENCRFIKANFENVKFSGCTFVKCHFQTVRFDRCQFIGCTFGQISASAQLLKFHATSISATAFLRALVTNLEYLPSTIPHVYQEHRFLADRTRIARAIFLSVRDEPDLDHLFDANETFELCRQHQRIGEAKWRIDGSKLVEQSKLSRLFGVPVSYLHLFLMQAAGFSTKWGRSPFRTTWYLVTIIVLFGILYASCFSDSPGTAFLRSLDCALVFGYTRYPGPLTEKMPLAVTMFTNAFLGFSWYALFIPALSKRLFR